MQSQEKNQLASFLAYLFENEFINRHTYHQLFVNLPQSSAKSIVEVDPFLQRQAANLCFQRLNCNRTWPTEILFVPQIREYYKNLIPDLLKLISAAAFQKYSLNQTLDKYLLRLIQLDISIQNSLLSRVCECFLLVQGADPILLGHQFLKQGKLIIKVHNVQIKKYVKSGQQGEAALMLNSLLQHTINLKQRTDKDYFQYQFFVLELFKNFQLFAGLMYFLKFRQFLIQNSIDFSLYNQSSSQNNLLAAIWKAFQLELQTILNLLSPFKLSLQDIQTSVFRLDSQAQLLFLNKPMIQKLKCADIQNYQRISFKQIVRDCGQLISAVQNYLATGSKKNLQISHPQYRIQIHFEKATFFEISIFVSKKKLVKNKLNYFREFSDISSQDGSKKYLRMRNKISSMKQDKLKDDKSWLSMWVKEQLSEQFSFKAQNNSLKRLKSQQFHQPQKIEQQLQKQMQTIQIDEFKLNVLQLQNSSKRFSLPIKVFLKRKFIQHLQISLHKFIHFLQILEDQYNVHLNPFHNYIHGINVMYSAHLITRIVAQQCSVLDEISQFTLVLASLCHDVGHTGRTNLFQINSSSQLALTYNDKSPLQNFHIAKSFQIFNQTDLLESLKKSRDKYNLFRLKFISNILYTDITEHFPLLSSFVSRYRQPDFGSGKDDVNILCGIIIHSSDFAGTAKPFDISKEWSLRVNKQFSQQFKMQGQLGIPQTPFFKDLQKPQVLSKCESGFIKVIVRPLYKQLNEFVKGRLDEQLQQLDNSVACWNLIPDKPKHQNIKEEIEDQ